MCVSTALQESLEHILFLGNALKYLPLVCEWGVNFNYKIIHAGNDDFSNPIFFWENFMKIPLLAKPFSLRQLPLRPFRQTLFVECDSHCIYFSE